MGRVHGSRRDPRKDEYGKISRGCRRYNWGDCHLEGFWRVLVEIPSILHRPRARMRQYPGSWRADEHSDGGSGELSGDDLARFHGLVLPRSRGFRDKQLPKRSWASSSAMVLGRRACLGGEFYPTSTYMHMGLSMVFITLAMPLCL
ncbi:calcineurin B-like protein 8 [Actinidia rufa]|uniref:Calcineurin B-like protein 8 n=1 Tax=Actinidia rufa TaxID=165716 RepID=A0A7J0ECP7_9ERIC|nr:calcineurin B-like protein 8 [Actinidia rufa]